MALSIFFEKRRKSHNYADALLISHDSLEKENEYEKQSVRFGLSVHAVRTVSPCGSDCQSMRLGLSVHAARTHTNGDTHGRSPAKHQFKIYSISVFLHILVYLEHVLRIDHAITIHILTYSSLHHPTVIYRKLCT